MTGAAVAEVRDRMAAAARTAGRDPGAVLLVAATKTATVDHVSALLDAGVTDVGENRAQELVVKADALAGRAEPPRWHFLGRLQRNKVGSLASHVALWQSVDRGDLGVAIARRAPGASVLVQVDLGDEPQKGGCATRETDRLVDTLRGLGLSVEGLMAVPPWDGRPRRWFAALRELGRRLGLAELSMGMSADYEVAIEEGATIVRVGRALLGERRLPR